MDDDRDIIVDWVAREVLPHEARVRCWLARVLPQPSDVDDVVQEAYCRLSALERVDHIERSDAYFFTTVRSIVLQRLRRSKTVSIDVARDPDAMEELLTDAPSPEREIGARRELDRVMRLIDELPVAYRRVIELRRIQGLSQRETARILGVTEHVVENHSVRGLRMILRALAGNGTAAGLGDMTKTVPVGDVRTRVGARH